MIDFACWWYPLLFGSGLTILAGRAWRRIAQEMDLAAEEARQAETRRRRGVASGPGAGLRRLDDDASDPLPRLPRPPRRQRPWLSTRR